MESISKALEIEKRGEINWILSVTCNTDALPVESTFPQPIQPLAVNNIRSAQNAEVLSRGFGPEKNSSNWEEHLSKVVHA